jgi:hypothetical protein
VGVIADNHISCRRRLKFPATAERKGYKSKDLYGERSAGKAAVAMGADVIFGSRCSKGGHGPEDSTKIPASATAAERDTAKTYVATRPDPFAGVWDEVERLLKVEPGLQAKTIFEYLQEKDPGRFSEGQVRTLQRRIKIGRALEGPPGEIFFAQDHYPGELCQSDFTHCRELGITIREFTRAYEGLLRYYGLVGQKIQAGEAHENGDIEQRHYRFKQAVDQALMMRGSRDFASVAAYDQFLRKLFAKMNAGRRERFAEELLQLRPLPERRLDSMRREHVRVTPGSLIHVQRNTYSVHSRLIGEMVEARIKPDTVEVWYGDRKSAVLQVGRDLQRRHDHCRCDRPTCSPLRDSRAQHPELSCRTGQESKNRGGRRIKILNVEMTD